MSTLAIASAIHCFWRALNNLPPPRRKLPRSYRHRTPVLRGTTRTATSMPPQKPTRSELVIAWVVDNDWALIVIATLIWLTIVGGIVGLSLFSIRH